MRIRLNRFTALLLLILLLPIVLPIKLYRWVTATGTKPVYQITLEGDPLAYFGERPVVVGNLGILGIGLVNGDGADRPRLTGAVCRQV